MFSSFNYSTTPAASVAVLKARQIVSEFCMCKLISNQLLVEMVAVNHAAITKVIIVSLLGGSFASL